MKKKTLLIFGAVAAVAVIAAIVIKKKKKKEAAPTGTGVTKAGFLSFSAMTAREFETAIDGGTPPPGPIDPTTIGT